MTTVAQVNTSVPRPFPVLSMNAMMRTKRFRCFSGGVGAALHRRRVAAPAAGRAIFLQRLFLQFVARRLARPPCFHNDIEQGLQRERRRNRLHENSKLPLPPFSDRSVRQAARRMRRRRRRGWWSWPPTTRWRPTHVLRCHLVNLLITWS